MTLPRIDHYGHSINSRDDLEETIVYTTTGTERIIPYLKPGDRARLLRSAKSYPQIVVEVVGTELDSAIVEYNGREYMLHPSWQSGLERSPWLRRNGKSKGEVKRLTILELNNE